MQMALLLHIDYSSCCLQLYMKRAAYLASVKSSHIRSSSYTLCKHCSDIDRGLEDAQHAALNAAIICLTLYLPNVGLHPD